MDFAGRAILLDIEGTTSSIDFVYQVMFPYVRTKLRPFLEAHWDSPDVAAARERIARDAGHDSFAAATVGQGEHEQRLLLANQVINLMDQDAKATGLKQLQGLIWKDGFESGELVAHLFPDVAPALRRWRDAGLDLRIYSSGSVAAQKLFFGHCEAGDLLDLFSGFHDTTTGRKRETASYRAIATDWGVEPASILFISDVVAELDAAREAGLLTALSVRPGNATVDPGHGHPVVTSFDDITLTD